jgi:4-hydroxy-tetrahydrodipicolinate reductase
MTKECVEVIVCGVKGRMGQAVLLSCAAVENIRIIGGTEAPGGGFAGQQTGPPNATITITENLAGIIKPGSVLIDFSAPFASLASLKTAIKAKAKMVIGVTGFSQRDKETIRAASAEIPIVLAPNMSIGINVLFKISETVARALGKAYDVEIIEAHHKNKKDAPSGTALGLAESVVCGHGSTLDSVVIYGRKGNSETRPEGQIGIHAVRGGDIVGDHTVCFAGDAERIELKHIAHDRANFANGAIKAALFLKDKNCGFFTMQHVLGLA